MKRARLIVTFLFVVSMTLLLITGANAEGLSPAQKDEVEQMMHDYIVKHPDLLMQSVSDFQRDEMAKRGQEAVKENHDELYKDDRSPSIGNPDGDVTLIEFFDYNCHYCKQIFPEVKKLIENDKKLKIVFKDFPILGPTSEVAAKWALAAQMQGKYFPFHQKVMELDGKLTDGSIEEAAKSVGVDVVKAKADLERPEIMEQIDRNRNLGQKMNFSGTPAFVINEDAIPGVPSGGNLEQIINEARQKAGAKQK